MLEKAWKWTGRHLFSSYIFETVLKSFYKKYAFWIITDTRSIITFSYLCASSANFFQSEEHSYFPTQVGPLSMELEPTDTKAVLKLPFRCLYRGVQVEMHCYQYMLKTHWTHSRLSTFFQPSVWDSLISRVQGCPISEATFLFGGSHQKESYWWMWKMQRNCKQRKRHQREETILASTDCSIVKTLRPVRQLYSYITILCCCEHVVNQYRMGFWISLSIFLFFFLAGRINPSEHQKHTKIA